MRSTVRCLSVSSLVLLLVVLAAGGCVPTEHDSVFDITYNPCEPLVIEAANELRPDELDTIERAVAMWNEAASVRLQSEHLRSEPVSGVARLPVRFEKGAPFVNGYYSDETGEVIINRNLVDAHELTITLAHELGHAFGLRHVQRHKRRSLMNAGNLETEVTPRDIEVLRDRWQGCPDSH